MSRQHTHIDDERTDEQPASRADPRGRASLAGSPTGVSYILQAMVDFPAPCGDSGAYDKAGLRHAEVA